MLLHSLANGSRVRYSLSTHRDPRALSEALADVREHGKERDHECEAEHRAVVVVLGAEPEDEGDQAAHPHEGNGDPDESEGELSDFIVPGGRGSGDVLGGSGDDVRDVVRVDCLTSDVLAILYERCLTQSASPCWPSPPLTPSSIPWMLPLPR